MRRLVPLFLMLSIAALIPLVVIAKARVRTSNRPRIHVVRDMDYQDRYNQQSANPLFADGRAMRLPEPGTVARGELQDDDHYHRGVEVAATGSAQWATALPRQVRERLTPDYVRRGGERYRIFCAPCHGLSGHGDGVVAQRAQRLTETQVSTGQDIGMQWVAPTSYHDDRVRALPVGHLFNVATNGIRNMAGYGDQIPVDDRWAIVCYIRALQAAQNPSPR